MENNEKFGVLVYPVVYADSQIPLFEKGKFFMDVDDGLDYAKEWHKEIMNDDNSEYGHIGTCVLSYETERPWTNADLIRSMTNEELANFLKEFANEGMSLVEENFGDVLDWLQYTCN